LAGAASVIVVRIPNWLGDTVMALPALGALRTARPAARIMVVGRWAPLLTGQGVADILLEYPRRGPERLAFARALRAERPDLAILLVNSLESALAAWMWRAPRRLGFDTDGRRPLLSDPIPLPSPRRHQAEEYGVLLAADGVSLPDPTPTWRRPRASSADGEAETLVRELGAGEPLVGLHLGAAFGPSKLWPTASYGQLAQRLRRRGLSPVLLGSVADRAAAERVEAATGFALPSLVGRDRPALLPALLSRFSCLVSADTGVAHLAAALGVPTVTLFGPTDAALSAPRAPAARTVVGKAPCAPCFLTECPIDHTCMRGITPDEVEGEVRAAVAA